MYIWNKDALLRDLKVGLSEREDMKYLLFTILLFLITEFVPTTGNTIDFMMNAITMIVFIGIIFYTFKINTEGRFVSKYLALSCVIFFRSLVFILLPLVLLSGITMGVVYGENIPETSNMYDVILVLAYSLGIAYLYKKYFEELNKIQ